MGMANRTLAMVAELRVSDRISEYNCLGHEPLGSQIQRYYRLHDSYSRSHTNLPESYCQQFLMEFSEAWFAMEKVLESLDSWPIVSSDRHH